MNTIDTKPNILIVDDEEVMIAILRSALKSFPCNLFTAQGGQQALPMVKNVKPDLILMDVVMPGLSGLEVCRRLKLEEETGQIPVIFLSSITETNQKVAAFDAGGVDYISKPIEPKELLARVSLHIKLYKLQKRLYEEIEFSEQLRQTLALKNEELVKKNNALVKSFSTKDELTQTATRYYTDERLAHEWARLAREENRLSLILVAVNRFSDYIFSYGHSYADKCLVKVADIMKQQLKRPADMIGRYQREIFMIILPNTTADGAKHIANQIKQNVDILKIPHQSFHYGTQYVSVSVGLTTVIPNAEDSFENAVKVVYEALKQAKSSSENTIIYKSYHETI